MALSTTSRWILIALISMGLQLCCCNIKSMLGAGCSDQPTDGMDQILATSIDAHGHHDQSDCNGHCRAGSSTAHDRSSSPCSSRDPHDGSECACGAHDKTANLIQHGSLDLPLTIVATLPLATVLTPTFTISAREYGDVHAVLPPPSSLLRQHCALTI